MAPTQDEIMKQEIIDHLIWDNRVDASRVKVDVSDGKVILNGTVPHHLAKLAAVNDVFRVAGIRNVQNSLKVEFPPDTEIPSDEELARKIENMLRGNDKLESSDIHVNARNGIVTLSGTVETFWGKNMAEDVSGSAKGVVDVINNLSVRLKETVIDRDIERDINNAYKRSMLVDEDRIGVKVDGGVVHLTGVVSNYLIKNEVHNIALYTAGVTDVIDEVTIG